MNWRCQYCGRENYADLLTCAGCQAPHRRAVAARPEMTYKGRPLSTLTDAEMDEAAEAIVADPCRPLVVDLSMPPALAEAIIRRLTT